ncbi:inositol 2-dehydrogenase [Clostridium beijerinckii]|uniref:Myo-inositol 2-dehydrogenase/D-chiro-inositol 1-dehydrogenase n=2 Tax=Clostridium beijerinckii TaxID=1520 RepID=A0A9Q5CH16_CLOBE|nr:inositol 2-dehydrogenase [Clostridium beijerinckii]AQS07403.1 inositol 2-dehydrogenase [Clostridium beijerinckii]MBA2884535.1 myo-inositol 2-dehydrogenase/D-chiro-inositol 1-dehydrogenase [Clostridium beijerinckii]MBA2898095.1 myo-inositol 2-dehydrogenase/D-chiro-inositol 1-dehydrogenase [Clostridium beijerinckii]MBA2909946.1 myo-inositol 2-dehydrogenase/D-chiro-inositol 1-dehydrogenase [Clostridium beijerinckii]MBA9012964.1 myo-inositol 2-dehydrogenase/D-chiro-inositol 1-dehydrogenase [Clo
MLKVGIIGAGRIGKVHGESISKYVKNAKVKAIADVFLNEATINWAREIGIQGVYKDYKKILEDPEIDAILICSSTDTHSKISIEAISAGKHVFCEKPIDHDLARIKEVIDELNKSNVKYQVGFNRRYDHNFKAIRNAVVEGKIGEPHVLKITSRDPEPPSIDYVKVSGGIFLDMTIHDFDMARYLLGSDVVEVYAAGNVLVDNAIGEAGDIDTAIITLKMANGAMAVIDNSRQSSYGYDQRAEVFGSLGQVSVGNDSISKAVISTKDGVTAEKPLFFFLERYMQAYADEITEFIDAIVNNRDISVSADDGLKAVLIGEAATKSLKENRPVRISEIIY